MHNKRPRDTEADAASCPQTRLPESQSQLAMNYKSRFKLKRSSRQGAEGGEGSYSGGGHTHTHTQQRTQARHDKQGITLCCCSSFSSSSEATVGFARGLCPLQLQLWAGCSRCLCCCLCLWQFIRRCRNYADLNGS